MEQESRKTIGVIVECAKMTPEIFEKALSEMLQSIGNHQQPSGKTSLKQLFKQGKVESIAVDEKNIGGFSSIARKHDLTYALKRITAEDGSRKYLIAFNGKNVDVMNRAFTEFLKSKTEKEETLFSVKKVQSIEIPENAKEKNEKERERQKSHKPQQVSL